MKATGSNLRIAVLHLLVGATPGRDFEDLSTMEIDRDKPFLHPE